MRRRLVWRCGEEWHYHEAVECAVGADGSAPASSFLDELASGAWAEDPAHDPPADREQIHDYAQLLIKIEFVGMHGYPSNATAVNHLTDGVWEFKHGRRRLPYWDTSGDGTWSAKPRHQDVADRAAPAPDGGYWWYPDLEAYLRLGCPWPKQAQRAPEDKVDQAVRLREEDCVHDRQD